MNPIVKMVFNLVMKQLTKKFKFDKIQEYVEKPNELDKQVAVFQKKIGKYGRNMEEVEKDIATLKKDSHPPIFSNKDKNAIIKRLEKLEKKN